MSPTDLRRAMEDALAANPDDLATHMACLPATSRRTCSLARCANWSTRRT